MERIGRRILGMIRDPNIPLLNYRVRSKLETTHQAAISDLLIALLAEGKEILNYDHIETTIPKQPYSLEFGGRRYDILYKDGSYYVYIEVKTTRKKPKELNR